jgi:hypothetical protein
MREQNITEAVDFKSFGCESAAPHCRFIPLCAVTLSADESLSTVAEITGC